MATRKTTLMLDERVLASYKARAAEARRSLSSLIEEAMRVFDKRQESSSRPERWTLPVGSTGAYIGMADPTSNAEMTAESEKPCGDLES